MNDNKIKHLEMIQGIINRMASNSFSLKGWAVTLVAGIFALSSKDADQVYYLVAYIPIVMFWFLDSYYLRQERLFRKLYGKVRKINDDNLIDFDMATNIPEFECEETTFINCLKSDTEKWFYLPLLLVTTMVVFISNIMKCMPFLCR